jgi:fatty acid kinase
MSVLNGDLEVVRKLADAALASLEANRERIDDLNVYPVPDGDTGTNLTMTVRALVDAVDTTSAASRESLARDVTRGALMGARGNSGVIFSQIVRGAADVLGNVDETTIGVDSTARALRGATDAAYGAVRKPVEGTMLSVIRELAEEAETQAANGRPPVRDLLRELVRRGEEAVARTPEQLQVLKDAGVVDAGGAGLLELVRGITAAVRGEPLPQPGELSPTSTEGIGLAAIHQELSKYRYCTVFLIEGNELDRGALESELEQLGDSLLVVGDADAIKVHVHTDDPGKALSIGTRVGAIGRIEIANMHVQTAEREERLLAAVSECGIVAVVAGDGNRKLFESLAEPVGPIHIVEGGQTMNPSTADLVRAVQSLNATEVVLLPNNSNILLAAELAAKNADRLVEVVPTTSIPAGLAALLSFDGTRSAAENAAEMREAIASVATGEVTVASRDVELEGVAIRKGSWLGLAEDKPVVSDRDFDDVTFAVADRLLGGSRGLLTLLVGDDAPPLDAVIERIEAAYPDVEIDVQQGGQPHYALLLSAE